MRIGFNIDSFKAIESGGEIIPYGGVGTYLQELLRAMLALESENEYYLIRNAPGPVPLRHPRVHSLVCPLSGFQHAIRHSGLWRDRIIRKYRLDLLHEHHPDQPAARIAKIPLVVTIHDLIPILFPEKFPMFFSFIFRRYIWRNMRNAAAVISVSRCTMRDLCRFHPELKNKVRVIPIAGQTFVDGDSGISPAAMGIRKPYILNVSTVEPRKNHAALFDAFALIKENGYAHQLVCVGPWGWKTGPILRHAALVRYSKDILRIGQVDRAALRQIYQDADLMVYPTLYEGFGMPPLEAMEFNVPVIASRNSSLPETLGEAALYVSASPDGKEIAAAVREVLGDAGRRETMTRLGRAQWQRFTWENTARETLRLYELAAGRGRNS
jgi:glycosyltransferase involved in cell wall biosynthesis